MNDNISEYQVRTSDTPGTRVWKCKKLFSGEIIGIRKNTNLIRIVYEMYLHPKTKYIIEILLVSKETKECISGYILNIFLVNKTHKLIPGRIQKDLQELLKLIIYHRYDVYLKYVDLDKCITK